MEFRFDACDSVADRKYEIEEMPRYYNNWKDLATNKTITIPNDVAWIHVPEDSYPTAPMDKIEEAFHRSTHRFVMENRHYAKVVRAFDESIVGYPVYDGEIPSK